MTKSEQRKHFWIGFGKMTASMLIGATVGYAISKILIMANVI